MPLTRAVEARAFDWKYEGIALVTMSMYFVPPASSGLSAARFCASEPSTDANVSHPFMNSMSFLPGTNRPRFASARTF